MTARPSPLLFSLLLVAPAWACDLSTAEDGAAENGEGTSAWGTEDTDTDSTTDPTGSTDPTDDTAGSTTGESESDSAATDTGDGDGDDFGGPADCDELVCGNGGTCVTVDGQPYCECPEGTDWYPQTCETCAMVDAAAGDHGIAVRVIAVEGRFTVGQQDPPGTSFDYANIWLENTVTSDRVHLGDTREQMFSARITPGIYDLVYEAAQVGDTMPANPHVVVRKLALFESQAALDVDIPVVTVVGDITLDGDAPPSVSFDDANILLRDPSGHELLAGESDEGAYAVRVVPGSYEVVYRIDTAGDSMPANNGAVLDTVEIEPTYDDMEQLVPTEHDVPIFSTTLSGEFYVNGEPAPAVAFDDAGIALESATAGSVMLGKTSAGAFTVNLLEAEDYELVYMHEDGVVMPQNRHARLGAFALSDQLAMIDIPSVTLSGTITLNGGAPPPNQFDDGLVYLLGDDGGDRVPLANTNDGNYAVAVIPGTYTAYYSVETAGGTMPENTQARIGDAFDFDADANHDVPILAVAVGGDFSFGGMEPPASVYDDGRVFLRSMDGEDTVLLGNTHEGDYSAMVVPGDYELFYVQEVGGGVPTNQNAALGPLSVQGEMLDAHVDVPTVDLSGFFSRADDEGEQAAPTVPSDGGQIYLRSARGDVALLGESHANEGFTAKLVSGTYGLYYRSEASETMPQNENGRFACIEVGQTP